MPARLSHPAPSRTVRHSGIYTFDLSAVPWKDAGKQGLYHKLVRYDAETSLSLGMLAFDPLTRSGLHQHLGTACSFFVDGGLTDYQGSATIGEAGINIPGATHDAISYGRSVMITRLEGPVIYPPSDDGVHSLHAGAYQQEFVNQRPEVPADIQVRVDAVPVVAVNRYVTRQMIFDYVPTGDRRRFVQLRLLPGARIPRHRLSGLVEWYVRAGEVMVGNERAVAGDFVILEPGIELSFTSNFGCCLLAWAEGSIEWVDDTSLGELYGFNF